jgi:hypothetical protein
MSQEPEFSDESSSASSQRGASTPDPDEFDSGAGERGGASAGPDPFAQDSFEEGDDPFSGGEALGGPSRQDQLRMAWDVTRMWVKDHQTATMLGAFAAGVFVGAYLRD